MNTCWSRTFTSASIVTLQTGQIERVSSRKTSSRSRSRSGSGVGGDVQVGHDGDATSSAVTRTVCGLTFHQPVDDNDGVMNQTPTNQVHADRTSGDAAADIANPLAVWRIGIAGGLTAILCCVGPTVLAMSAWSAQPPRSSGPPTSTTVRLVVPPGWARRDGEPGYWCSRRNQCTLAGVRSLRKRLLGILGIAVTTYAMLYAVTTWLGTLA